MLVSKFDKRNRFNYNWSNFLTCKMGYAIPYDIIEVLPGDTWKYKAIPFLRMLAQIAPTMGELVVRQHSIYVPTRIIWPHFYEGYMIPTENSDGTLTTATIPTITNTWTKGSLGDYLHYPLGVPYTCNAFKIRAYQKAIRDWYMNLNIEDLSDVPLSDADGVDTTTSLSLYNVNWPKDRFTGCYKEKQRGPEVILPLGDEAPIYGGDNNDYSLPASYNIQPLRFVQRSGAYPTEGASGTGYALNLSTPQHEALGTGRATAGSVFLAAGTGNNPTSISSGNDQMLYPANLYADLRQAVGLHPDEFRLAFQVEKKLRMDMLGGQRTPEWLLTHYGVRCSDARLQRSEFLGGSKSYFNVSEVLQTSATNSTSPQGNMAGHGYCVYSTKAKTKTFEEHGYIINIISIAPRAIYTGGSPREDLKRTPEEFGLPVLSHTIMDAIYKGELKWTNSSTDLEPFGYRNIYDEYRQRYSTLAGEFRDTLDYWTWARKFNNVPALNKQFIQVEQIDRPFATTGTDHFLVAVKNIARAYRPLPKRGDPGLIDHQ